MRVSPTHYPILSTQAALKLGCFMNTPIGKNESGRVCAPVRAAFHLPWKTAKRLTFDQWTLITNCVLAAATVFLAVGVMWQINIMEDDQRPWVGIGSLQVIPATPNQQELYLLVEITNSGKSPALDVAITTAEWNSNPDTLLFPITKCKDECRVDNEEILPGAFVGIRIPKVNQFPVPLIGNKMNIVIRVDYRDTHNKQYYTGICKVVTTSPDPRSNRSVIVDQASCAKANSNRAT